MIERMNWHDAYKIWKGEAICFPNDLCEPIHADRVFVKYTSDEFIYGFDWLRNSRAKDRKKMIKKDPIQFLDFTRPTNKGTIHTAQMLEEAMDQEERAAIWTAATAFELMECGVRNGISRHAQQLYYSAIGFLKDRFWLWHPAMRKLVPDIMIPKPVLESMKCDRSEVVMDLIQINTLMVKSSYTILRYSSISDEELKPEKDRLTLRR